jgi:hypothetical protein
MSDLIERLEWALSLFQPRMDRQLLLDAQAALRSAAAREAALVEALRKIADGPECWQRDTALDALAAAKGDAP